MGLKTGFQPLRFLNHFLGNGHCFPPVIEIIACQTRQTWVDTGEKTLTNVIYFLGAQGTKKMPSWIELKDIAE